MPKEWRDLASPARSYVPAGLDLQNEVQTEDYTPAIQETL